MRRPTHRTYTRNGRLGSDVNVILNDTLPVSFLLAGAAASSVLPPEDLVPPLRKTGE